MLSQSVAQNNYQQVIDALQKGASPNENSNGETVLHTAVKGGNTQIVSLLLTRGANSSGPNSYGLTPLHYAARTGAFEVTHSLLQHNARVDSYDTNGWTPLHYAAYHGHFRIAELLCQHNAPVNAVDHLKRSPIFYACKNGYTDITIHLIRCGARWRELDNNGSTAFDLLPLAVKDPPAADQLAVTSKAIAADLKKLFQTQTYSDLKFVCPDERTFPAHKCVIQCRCPRLMSTMDQYGVVRIQTISPEALRAILQFVYSGTIEFENDEMGVDFAFELVAKGEELGFESLTSYSESIILDSMDENSVLPVRQFAQQFRSQRIEQQCNHYIMKHLTRVPDLTPELLATVLTQLGLSPRVTPVADLSRPPAEIMPTQPPPPPAQPAMPKGQTYTTKQEPQAAHPYSSAPPPQVPYGGPPGANKPKGPPQGPPAGVPKSAKPKPLSPAQFPQPPMSAMANAYPPAGAPKKQTSPPSAPYPGQVPLAARPKTAGAAVPFDNLVGRPLEACKKLIKELKKETQAFWFNDPVDPQAFNLIDYRDIITKPMDLGTVTKKLNAKQYKTVRQFAADVRLVFDNARIYNAAMSDVYSCADTLSKVFEDRYRQMKAEIGFPPDYDLFKPKTPAEYQAAYSEGHAKYVARTGHQAVNPQAAAPLHHQQYQTGPPHHQPPPNTGYGHHQAHQPTDHHQAPPPRPAPGHPPQPNLAYPPPPHNAHMQKSHAPPPHNAHPPGNNGVANAAKRKQPSNGYEDLANVPLTDEEMEKLSSSLNDLNDNQISHVVSILNLAPNEAGAYEISINELELPVLRKLQAYVAEIFDGPAAKRVKMEESQHVPHHQQPPYQPSAAYGTPGQHHYNPPPQAMYHQQHAGSLY